MYERTVCGACYLKNGVLCMTCKAEKPPCPSGVWDGHFWYCDSECARKKPFVEVAMCGPHKDNLEKLRRTHPNLFRVAQKAD